MTRIIPVTDSDGMDNYVVVEDTPVPEFYLPTREVLTLESAERFEDAATGMSYYAVNDEDKEWLLGL